MSNAFLYRMPAGIAGDIQRREHATVEPGMLDASYPALAYGVFLKLVSGLYRIVASGDTIATVAVNGGFLARPFPIQEAIGTSAANELLGGGAPDVTKVANIMKRGYISVKVTAGGSTALADIKKGDPVYIRVTADTGKVVGDIEGGTVSGNELLPGAYFMGGVDANGMGEIAFNI